MLDWRTKFEVFRLEGLRFPRSVLSCAGLWCTASVQALPFLFWQFWGWIKSVGFKECDAGRRKSTRAGREARPASHASNTSPGMETDWYLRKVPRRSVKPGTIFVGIRRDLAKRNRWSTRTGLKRKIAPGRGNFFGWWRDCAPNPGILARRARIFPGCGPFAKECGAQRTPSKHPAGPEIPTAPPRWR